MDALVAAEVSADASEKIFAKVKQDFLERGVDQSDHQIRRTMEELLAKATEEIKDGK